MHVLIIRRTVQTGNHLGRKGEVLDVPKEIGTEWIASKHARQATEKEIAAAAKAEPKQADVAS